MFLKNVKYLLSAPSKKYWLDNKRKEIAILGRSNVGKSTFINKITNNNSMAKVSKMPGYTKYLNFFDVNNEYYLVDTPGYGYAKASWSRDESFYKMMDEYLTSRDNLICVIILVDAKIGFTSDDIMLIEMLHQYQIPLQVIASKTDKSNQANRYQLKKQALEILKENEVNNMLLYASSNNKSIEEVVNRIIDIYQSV